MTADAEGMRPAARELDDLDRRIISVVVADARLSHREIGRRLGMSPGAISQRVNRLEHLGVIRGYHAAIEPGPLGFRTEAMIGLQVIQGQPVVDTMAELYAIPEVQSVCMVTGQWDFLVVLQARDQEHLREVLIDRVWTLPLFRHSETMIVLQRMQRHASWFAADQPPAGA
jgi:DNA-binding Lrp family transcriptional regulator